MPAIVAYIGPYVCPIHAIVSQIYQVCQKMESIYHRSGLVVWRLVTSVLLSSVAVDPQIAINLQSSVTNELIIDRRMCPDKHWSVIDDTCVSTGSVVHP